MRKQPPKGDGRRPNIAMKQACKVVSNNQWAMGQAIRVLKDAQSAKCLSDVGHIETLSRGIAEALAYLCGENRRPGPEPGEDRLWHQAHEPGEPCEENH